MASSRPSKREITRARVVEAAIDCIYREGFHAANTNRIAARANVTWGVLQYHFGDKDRLLQAVLDHIFNDFLETLENAELDGNDLNARLQQLIDVVWSLLSKKEYRVSIAILRNAGKDESSVINGQAQVEQWACQISRLWEKLLPAEIADSAMSETARHLLFASLRGLADEINPGASIDSTSRQAERAALSNAIHYLLLSN